MAMSITEIIIAEDDISVYIDDDANLPQSDGIVQELEDKTCTVSNFTNLARVPTYITSQN